MQLFQQLIFLLILGLALFLFARRIVFIRKNIKLGKSDKPRNDQKGKRWRNMALFALGQKKMFKRWFPAIMHLLIYVGFILINIELIEIIADGLTSEHRIFAPFLGGFYTFMISFFELLAVGVFISCVVFLWRRNVQKIPRFHNREMKGWPMLDGNLILIFEIILVGALLFMNAADLQIQDATGIADSHYVNTGTFLISGLLQPIFSGVHHETLIFFERTLWWVHILGILFFLNYVTYSKHLHIILAFPNTWYGEPEPQRGKMDNMPEIQNEVQMMLNPDAAPDGEAPPPPDRFGARDVPDLSWKNILDAYSCTECGRCTSACPANQTGKLLSPRKIMMDVRDRAEEIGHQRDKKKDEAGDKSLIGAYIKHEELLACTTCNACVEECPVNINPLDIIFKLRRHMIMDEAKSPSEWNVMFGNVENNMAPWQFSPEDRFKWSEGLESSKETQS